MQTNQSATEALQARRLQLEMLAIAEHKAAVGKLFTAEYLSGYLANTEEHVEEYVDAIVRVCPVSDDATSGVLHWNDSWLDPYWDVEIISSNGRLRGFDAWVDGPSHSVHGHANNNRLTEVNELEELNWLESNVQQVAAWIGRALGSLVVRFK